MAHAASGPVRPGHGADKPYSVPVRLIGRQVRVLLHASHLVIYDSRAEAARHERLPGRLQSRLDLDHCLEALVRKPGSLPGSTALEARKSADAGDPAAGGRASAPLRLISASCQGRISVPVYLFRSTDRRTRWQESMPGMRESVTVMPGGPWLRIAAAPVPLVLAGGRRPGAGKRERARLSRVELCRVGQSRRGCQPVQRHRWPVRVPWAAPGPAVPCRDRSRGRRPVACGCSPLSAAGTRVPRPKSGHGRG